MPNWCFNSVVVSAKKESELEEFLSFIRQTHFSHHADFRTGEVEGETSGVFWNFKSPEDINAYYGKTEVLADDEEDESIDYLRAVEQSKGWYNWNNANWGTKWDIAPPAEEDIDISGDDESGCSFYWNFNTAWAPAEEAYRLMAERFPNLTFGYEITEEGNFFAGKLFYEDGEIVDEIWRDTPTHQDYLDLDIPCAGCSFNDSEEDPCHLIPEEETAGVGAE